MLTRSAPFSTQEKETKAECMIKQTCSKSLIQKKKDWIEQPFFLTPPPPPNKIEVILLIRNLIL